VLLLSAASSVLLPCPNHMWLQSQVLHAKTAGEEPATSKDAAPERIIIDELKSTFMGECNRPMMQCETCVRSV
jgi:hypothetical protein